LPEPALQKSTDSVDKIPLRRLLMKWPADPVRPCNRLAGSGFEITRSIAIRNQTRLLRLPAQIFPSPLAGPRNVSADEMCEPAEMLFRFLGRLPGDGNIQTATDDSGCLRLQDFQMRTKAPKATDRKPRADAQRNRERILGVAKREFTRLGANASLEELAKKAGVGPGTLYPDGLSLRVPVC
jgi:hypothetical protein